MEQAFLDRYVRTTRETAIYPDVGTGSPAAMLYVHLGLVGEAGEVVGKVKKAIRDDRLLAPRTLTTERRDDLVSELGDVLWYLARFVDETGEGLPVPNWRSWVDPADAPSRVADLPQLALGLVVRCSSLARHRGAELDVASRLHDVRSVMDRINEISTILGPDLTQLGQANITKLAGRAHRGTLQGSGDHR